MSVDRMITDAGSASSFNRFAYAKNSPFNTVDPDGRESISFEAMLGFGGGLTVGYSNGELALTMNLGAGLGGGIQIDPRASENGRMSPTVPAAKPALGGIAIAGYGKAGAEVGTPVGTGALGMKVGGGKDLVTGQEMGGSPLRQGSLPKWKNWVSLHRYKAESKYPCMFGRAMLPRRLAKR